jgi:hypothetical protein
MEEVMKLNCLLPLAMAALLCACDSTPSTTASRSRHRSTVDATADDTPLPAQDDAPVEHLPVAGQAPPQSSSPLGGGSPADQAITSDVSDLRMDDILGGLLFYFRSNHQMPAKLEDLRPIVGRDLNTDNASDQPFVYVPAGLRLRGSSKLLVVYDPHMHDDHTRWVILLGAFKAGAPPTGEVLSIPEVIFQAYLKSGQ